MEETADAAVGLGEDWRWVEAVLPTGWQAQARELGALRRARGFADASALLRTLLIHLAEGCGLRQTAERARLAGLAQVSDVALLKRLKAAGAWFEWMAQGLRQAAEPADMAGMTGALAGRRLRVVDGSVVREPGPGAPRECAWPASTPASNPGSGRLYLGLHHPQEIGIR